MAAGGFREFVAGETLDENAINDYLMQGMLVFAGTAARGSAIPSPVEGQFTYLADSDSVEFYDGSQFVPFTSTPTGTATVSYLVIAGGGGGGGGESATIDGGAGGAGGYRNSYASETSGGSSSTETPAAVPLGFPQWVKVGAGGSGGGSATNGSRGGESVFYRVISIGGGMGPNDETSGQQGGSGSGAGGEIGDLLATRTGFGLGIAGQGSNGSQRTGRNGGAGGGAGGNASGSTGGVGLASSITGSSVTRGVGGSQLSSTAGAANTGNGGNADGTTGGNGGSGVVIIRYSNTLTLTVGAGLTSSTTTSGSDKITTFTAGEDTVTFS